jgi:hypothetical protein
VRLQLFEFHDVRWFPRPWRRLVTACTGGFARLCHVYDPLVPRLAEAMRDSGARTVLDLCSGSDSPVASLYARLAEESAFPVQVRLSDKYPDPEAFDRTAVKSAGAVEWVRHPVGAEAVPADLDGFRTVFTAFHHFRPPVARAILEDAVSQRVGIGVFEFTERSLTWLVALPMIPFFVWLTAPFIVRPFRFKHFFWLYVLPIPLLCVVWDAAVSCLRSYAPGDLAALCADLQPDDYTWEVGRLRQASAWRVTYLLGIPHKNGSSGPGTRP